MLKSIQTGFGEALGFIAVVVGLGAMIGRFLEYSGGGRALADWLLLKFGNERAVWAVLVAAFLVGLPIFFEVGFIILVPLVWNLAREIETVAAVLRIADGGRADHHALAGAAASGARRGRAVAGRQISAAPFSTACCSRCRWRSWAASSTDSGSRSASSCRCPRWRRQQHAHRGGEARAAGAAGGSAAAAAGAADLRRHHGEPARHSVQGRRGLLGHPFTALTITTLVAIYFFGIRRGLNRTRRSKLATESLAPIGTLLCIMGGGGAFKQVIVDSGVGPYLGKHADDVGDLAAAGGVPDGAGDAHGAGLGHGGDHHRGRNRGADGEGHPRLSPEMLVLALCCGGTRLFARERFGLLDGELSTSA